ncbi:MAG: hypothetical protein ACOX64_06665 [Candidatus Merdivicinus sp.]|jgi:ATP-dependent DNA ligase
MPDLIGGGVCRLSGFRYRVYTVEFMEHTKNGGMRQPVFRGFRDDKPPEECMEKTDIDKSAKKG